MADAECVKSKRDDPYTKSLPPFLVTNIFFSGEHCNAQCSGQALICFLYKKGTISCGLTHLGHVFPAFQFLAASLLEEGAMEHVGDAMSMWLRRVY